MRCAFRNSDGLCQCCQAAFRIVQTKDTEQLESFTDGRDFIFVARVDVFRSELLNQLLASNRDSLE